nr:type II toxin-antitoxin system VapC family toxin [Geoalkalibacter sp.]
MFTLDTNALIYFFKGKGRVAEHLLAVAPQDIGIPAVVLFELEVGIAKSPAPAKRRSQLQQFLEFVEILPFDTRAAQASARIRAELESQGQPIGPLDCLIAGTALANRATLVTHNLKEFGRIKGLELVDWF